MNTSSTHHSLCPLLPLTGESVVVVVVVIVPPSEDEQRREQCVCGPRDEEITWQKGEWFLQGVFLGCVSTVCCSVPDSHSKKSNRAMLRWRCKTILPCRASAMGPIFPVTFPGRCWEPYLATINSDRNHECFPVPFTSPKPF